MTYKETLFFLGKCLTITHDQKNLELVKKELIAAHINWETIVKLSTKHYVFSALYCNFKRASLLQYVPEELVNYMKHITGLNRERNQKIIKQAKEIHQLLIANNIRPIFLKGTGNLLEGLYTDIAERMVGDIDFIVSKKDYQKTCKLLLSTGYSKVHDTSFDFPAFKHFPRLRKADNIAAVEIHKELLLENYAKEFNYARIKEEVQVLDNISFLSYQHQLSLSISAHQINDRGMHFKNIALRNAYDVFLLSNKVDSLIAILRFKKLFTPLNNYLAMLNLCLHSESIRFKKTSKSNRYCTKSLRILIDSAYAIKQHQKTALKLKYLLRFNIIRKAFYNKEMRHWLIKRLRHGRPTP